VWQRLVTDGAYAAGSAVEGESTLVLPAEAHASGPEGDSRFPYFEWYVGLRVKAKGQPQLVEKFPIVVGK
jgi:hypothetical protein